MGQSFPNYGHGLQVLCAPPSPWPDTVLCQLGPKRHHPNRLTMGRTANAKLQAAAETLAPAAYAALSAWYEQYDNIQSKVSKVTYSDSIRRMMRIELVVAAHMVRHFSQAFVLLGGDAVHIPEISPPGQGNNTVGVHD